MIIDACWRSSLCYYVSLEASRGRGNKLETGPEANGKRCTSKPMNRSKRTLALKDERRPAIIKS